MYFFVNVSRNFKNRNNFRARSVNSSVLGTDTMKIVRYIKRISSENFKYVLSNYIHTHFQTFPPS